MKRIVRRVGTGIGATALIAAALMGVGTQGASANPAGPGDLTGTIRPKHDCYYNGAQYSEGAVILVGNKYIKCLNGGWIPHN